MDGRASRMAAAPVGPAALAAQVALVALVALLAAGCSGSSAGPTAPTALPSSATSSAAAPITPATPTESTSPSPQATGALSTRLDDGRTKVSDASLGYEFVLPRGYTRITSADQLEEIAKAGSKALKNRTAELTAAAFQENVKVYAVNRLTGGTINLVVVDAGGSVSDDLADQAPQIKEALTSQLGATQVTTKRIRIDGDPALRADGTLVVAGNKVRLTQLYAIHDDQVFIITLGGTAKTSEKTVQAVIASERFAG